MSSSCRRIDPLVTPYVDGELAPADREAVDRHVRVCPPCRARVEAEQTVRETLGAHRMAFTAGGAPPSLVARCAAAAPQALVRARRPWRVRLAPLAVAAAIILVVAASFLYRATDSSARLLAAELTADHVKCFMINEVLGTHHDATEVTASMERHFDWDVQLPPHPEAEDLKLVGSRLCLYAEGRVGHIMYRYRGRPVSVFMLPNTARRDEVVEVMGHEAAIWSVGDRTFVLIADESTPDMARLASYVQRGLE